MTQSFSGIFHQEEQKEAGAESRLSVQDTQDPGRFPRAFFIQRSRWRERNGYGNFITLTLPSGA